MEANEASAPRWRASCARSWGARFHRREDARVEHIYPDLQVELALYRCSLHAGEEPCPLACEQVRWIERRDLPGLPFCEADVPILTRLAEEEHP